LGVLASHGKLPAADEVTLPALRKYNGLDDCSKNLNQADCVPARSSAAHTPSSDLRNNINACENAERRSQRTLTSRASATEDEIVRQSKHVRQRIQGFAKNRLR
jgi:hypothetical protein